MSFFIFLRILVLPALVSAATTDDSLALLNLKQRVYDPAGALTSWNQTTNFCSWKGIGCSKQGRVKSLRLQSLASLSTSLLSSLTETLSELRELSIRRANFTDSIDNFNPANCRLELVDLSDNQLHGSFPEKLTSSCMHVRLLNLSYNRLGGELDGVLSNSLETVDISDNSFNGSISPRLFQTCGRLRYLDLSNNIFTGQVPVAMLSNCISLEEISLAFNNLSGEFPSLNTSNTIRKLNLTSNSFTQFLVNADVGCINLTELDISSNSLRSSVFTATGACRLLRVLKMSGNLFSSGLEFTSFVPALEVLEASFNNLTGELPSLRNMSSLQYLDLSSNMFTTTANLCSNESKLESLILANNRLTGDSFTSVLGCRRLAMLDLSFNSLTGELPDNLCDQLPNLNSLLLTLNRLQGWIHSSLSTCSKLNILLLGYNNLQGVIPPELSQLSNLWWLDLSNNNISGTIPSSFGLLQNLEILQLSGNSLHGEIPRELSDCRHLVILELGSNNLTGSIPPQIGRSQAGTNSVNMNSYHIVGSLGNLRLIEALLPRCDFKGIVGTFLAQGITVEELQERVRERSGCSDVQLALEPAFTYSLTSVIYLDLSDNKLTGSIPPELGDMKTLFFFSAKHNLLSGSIPKELGKLRQMFILDLAYNALQGQIPPTIGELTFLKILNFSYNNLSGPIPQTGQLTTFNLTTYVGNPGLCGQPVSLNCSSSNRSSSPPSQSSEGGLDIEADVLVIGFVFGLLGFLACGSLVFFRVLRCERSVENVSADPDDISLVSQTRTWTLIGASRVLNILLRKGYNI